MSELIQLPVIARLQDALSLLAGRLGQSISADGIAQGLPLDNGRLGISFLGEAAARAGLTIDPVNIEKVRPDQCPLLLADEQGRAVVIGEIRPGGLATAVAADGISNPILLAALAPAGFTSAWMLRRTSIRDARTDTPAGNKSHFIRDAMWLSRDALWPVAAATVTINLLALAVPLISMNILDRVVSQAAFETLWALALGGLIALIADFVLRTLRGSIVDHASARSDVVLSNRIFGRVLGARLAGRQASVGVQSNSLKEYESLREICNSATIATIGDLPFAVLFLAVIWMVAGPLVLVPLAVVPLLLAAGLSTQWTLNDSVAEHFKDSAHKNAVAIEMLSGLETLKAHTAESWAASKWEAAIAAHLRHSLDMRWWMALSSNVITALQGLTTIAILVAGVYLVVDKTVSPGALFAAIMLAGRSLSPVSQIASLLAKIHHGKSAYKAVCLLADAEQERPEGLQFLAAPAHFGRIDFERVDMVYGKDQPAALRNLSLKIEPGERLGIIGAIGSGKSSFLRLLLGLRLPSAGAVTMQGVPVHQIDPASYRRLFGIAFREEAFFFGTIRDNLCLRRPEASDEEMVEAARMGGALGWIRALPQGFSSVVGESGQGLSSGQRQTLALSRAFLGNPSAILLDEPTSDLDARTEAEFVTRLRQLPKDVTLIAVTHRPAVLEACTRLVVLDAGGLLMDGEKTIVLARLKQIVTSQRNAVEASA